MYQILYRLLASLARLAVRSGRAKDLEIIVLRHQLGVLRRQINRPALDKDDRTLLGAIAAALPRPRRAGWLVTPDTLLRWHRRRTARHWTQPQRPPGRPATSTELRRLIPAMATENPTWRYRRIHGELAGLGHTIAASTIWQILTRAGIDPAPERASVTWSEFLRSQAAVACDFATIDTVTLRRFYLLLFTDIPTRTVYFGDHRAPDRRLDRPSRTEPVPAQRRPARQRQGPRARPRQPIHRLHRPPQHSPTPPLSRPTTTRRQRRRTATRSAISNREIDPPRRHHQRVPKRCLTSRDRIFGTHRDYIP